MLAPLDLIRGERLRTKPMKIIVGLGNPGFRYRNTRHNAGFIVIKALSKKYRINVKKKGFNGIYGIGRIENKEIMLFQPLTYMNLSGGPVKAGCSSRLSQIRDLLVVSDDFSIPLGTVRLREKGSSGGHNGLKSIIEYIGADFARLRIGIKTDILPEDKAKYVLSSFNRAEKSSLIKAVEKSVECIETWIQEGTKKAMSRFNQQEPPQR